MNEEEKKDLKYRHHYAMGMTSLFNGSCLGAILGLLFLRRGHKKYPNQSRGLLSNLFLMTIVMILVFFFTLALLS